MRFSNTPMVAALAAAGTIFAATASFAGAVTIANVSSSRWECTYAKTCSVSFDDTVSDLPHSHYASVSGLHSRTVNGTRDSPSEGRVGYLYRLDLTGSIFGECVHGVVLGVGSLDKVNYSLSGATDLVVVTSGWPGMIGVAAADWNALEGRLEVEFAQYVCPGQATYYFGFSAASAPRRPTDVNLFAASHPPFIPTKARVP